jgi:hypothetical protein
MAGMPENRMSEKGRDTVKVPSGGVKKEEGMVGGHTGMQIRMPKDSEICDHSQVRHSESKMGA